MRSCFLRGKLYETKYVPNDTCVSEEDKQVS